MNGTLISISKDRYPAVAGEMDEVSCRLSSDATSDEVLAAFCGMMVVLGYHPQSVQESLATQSESWEG